VNTNGLKKNNLSRRIRNCWPPTLANLLFFIKYIERWGTGTNDIIKWCREEGLPEPIFKEVTGGFAVVLRKFQISENLELLELNERQKKSDRIS